MRRPGGRNRPAGAARRRRRPVRVLALVVLGAVGLLFAAPAAYAAVAAPFSSCTQPPEAAAADEVVGGVLDPASADLPAPVTKNARPAAPARPATTELDLWGWSGFAWPDYDPGSSFGSCTLGQAGHIEDTVVGFAARAQLETLVWATAATTGVARAAYDPHRYDVLGGLEGTIRDGLGDGIAKVLFPLAAACVGGWLVITADRRTPREQARKAGTVVLLGISVTLVGVWTLTLGPRLDDQVTRAVTWVDATINRTPTDSDPGREIGESLRTNLIEPTWRFGTFGSIDSPIAKDFGPRLLHNSAISNQERADLSADPALKDDPAKLGTALSALADAKAQAYDKVAADLKVKDPRAYLVLAGSHNDRRLWAASVGWISFWGVGAIQWLASVLSIWCLVILRLIIQAWPAVALIGLVRPRAAARILGIAVGAAVADIGVSAVAAVERVAMRAVLGWQANGGGIAAVVLALVVAAISLWACWPFVRCVPGTPRRIRQLGTPFVSGRPPRSASGEVDAIEAGPSRVAVGAGRTRANPADELLAGVLGGLPAEAAPGREVVPATRAPAAPRPALPAPMPRDPQEEPSWTSVTSAAPYGAASQRSGPGSRGHPAEQERSLESA
jgi:hypothetical protein